MLLSLGLLARALLVPGDVLRDSGRADAWMDVVDTRRRHLARSRPSGAAIGRIVEGLRGSVAASARRRGAGGGHCLRIHAGGFSRAELDRDGTRSVSTSRSRTSSLRLVPCIACVRAASYLRFGDAGRDGQDFRRQPGLRVDCADLARRSRQVLVEGDLRDSILHVRGDRALACFSGLSRDAVAVTGHYASPAKATAFYRQMAEIRAACDAKKLECERQLIAEIPPVTSSQLLQFPTHIIEAVKMVLSARRQPATGASSSDDLGRISTDRRFLNYPAIIASSGDAPTWHALSGWFNRPGGGWVSVEFLDQGKAQLAKIDRVESPDLVGALKDQSAHHQRFRMLAICPNDCVLRIAAEKTGAVVEQPLKAP